MTVCISEHVRAHVAVKAFCDCISPINLYLDYPLVGNAQVYREAETYINQLIDDLGGYWVLITTMRCDRQLARKIRAVLEFGGTLRLALTHLYVESILVSHGLCFQYEYKNEYRFFISSCDAVQDEVSRLLSLSTFRFRWHESVSRDRFALIVSE